MFQIDVKAEPGRGVKIEKDRFGRIIMGWTWRGPLANGAPEVQGNEASLTLILKGNFVEDY